MPANARPVLPLLLLLGTVAPAAAADADACGNEVQRLTGGFSWLQPGVSGTGEVKQEPGMRQGAAIDDSTRQQLAELVQQARHAAEQGNAQGCLNSLAQVRIGLREAGFGAAQAGSPTNPGLAVGNRNGTTSGAGTAATAAPGSTGTTTGPGTSTGGTAGPSTGGTAADAGSPAFAGNRPDNSGITNSPGDGGGGGLGVGGTGGGLGGGGGVGGSSGGSAGGGSSGGSP
jgi:hypothetical protein